MSLLDKASLVVTPNAYKESKLYSVIPSDGSGDMTVVRATTARRVNSSSLIESVAINIPRIDYTNGSCPSLLVEPQRTNILLYSQNFNGASWGQTATTITANAGISPDGTNNANKFIPSTTATSHYISQVFTSSTSGSISIYAKADGYNNITLLTSNTNVNYNLSTGTVQAVGGVGTGAIQSVGNGWYRCILYKTLTTETLYISCGSNTNAGFFSGSGNGTSGVLIWGGQVEVGAYATSYIPTVASSVTRNADVISKSGISSLIGQTEGTIFIDFNVNNLASQTADPVIFSTSGTNYIRLSTARVISYFESNTVSIVSASNVVNNGRNKIAVNYKNNDFSLYVNGVLVGSNNSGAVVAKSNFSLNYIPTSIFDPLLFYNSIQLYKTKLTNAESIQLTTL